LALLGFILSGGRLAMSLVAGNIKATSGASLGIMALLCGLLTGLCIKSFIDAKRRREAEKVTTTE
jgi:hypothetical protein